VIGRAGQNLSPEEAGEHIAGYTIFNDWSARDVQIAEMRMHLVRSRARTLPTRSAPGS
jgi:2-keto-4-pentenoate hydratase/2-oxohepta-3-ene-1,7-dioic acid hydratase in catechol pathway